VKNLTVQSLDLNALKSNAELMREVGPVIRALYESEGYKLLHTIMECEQRRRSIELVDLVGTDVAIKRAAELKEMFGFDQTVLQIVNAFDALTENDAEEAREKASGERLDVQAESFLA
jgi:hypothetical protein